MRSLVLAALLLPSVALAQALPAPGQVQSSYKPSTGPATVAPAPAPAPVSADDPAAIQRQIDDLQRKLDAAKGKPVPVGAGPVPAPVPASPVPAAAPVVLEPGWVVNLYAAPSDLKGQTLENIPLDSVASYVQQGGAWSLAEYRKRTDWKNLASIQAEGYLKATEAGRHTLNAQLVVKGGNKCLVALWVENQLIGQATDYFSASNPVPLSAVGGADLAPGLNKVRVWISCFGNAQSHADFNANGNFRLTVKGPTDDNAHVAGADEILHKVKGKP